jgi:large subunit ribosomal protein L4
MHQALQRQLANARLGTHDTKTRGEVEGGGRKPWRQKGTGRARQGSTRAPNWVGGGIVFGPTPRKYTKAMPKKMQRAALRSALSAKAGSGQIVVLDKLAVDAPRTKTVVGMLKALGLSEQSVLMVLPGQDANVRRSANNVPNVKLLLSNYLNVRDLLGHDVVLLPNDALPQIEQWLAVEALEAAGEGEE